MSEDYISINECGGYPLSPPEPREEGGHYIEDDELELCEEGEDDFLHGENGGALTRGGVGNRSFFNPVRCGVCHFGCPYFTGLARSALRRSGPGDGRGLAQPARGYAVELLKMPDEM